MARGYDATNPEKSFDSDTCLLTGILARVPARTVSSISKCYLNSGYQVLRKIGGGSYSQVKEVSQGQHRFAVKVIDTTRVSDDFKGRFLPRELEILSRIDHRHIVNVLRIFKASEKVFIVMDLAEDGDLLCYIKKKKFLSDSRSRIYFLQIIDALNYLHGLDVAHRDLKCENILMKSSRHVKLADFGFSRPCSKDGRRVLSRTFCGSTFYASPEVLQGKAYNPKLYDVWSLGCILFIMLCGVMPFDDTDPKLQVKQQLCRNIAYPKTPVVSPEAKDLLRWMLEPDVLMRTSVPRILSHPWLSSKSGGDNNFLNSL
ncbi:testis-specific serine/threonine-protein kinase 3-like [Galendromus occidentalis]|uniref:Testis-specific serine/threonine-protein kinase 3-like n=1 Tax=Galendromus occidentalis TaxID=34638 RepID=A0AAJ7L803_9ACAR|nr:testis-specific serine/threonine-protein kinase 3-like [Galendromus occidentalis]